MPARDYHPCSTGIHVMGFRLDGAMEEEIITIYNFHIGSVALARELYETLRPLEAKEGEPKSYVVDLFESGSLVDGFHLPANRLEELIL